ncbi:TetR/AcrR family transcriptional regulator [Sinanaerobacter chloroacetimidivorans]|jgi:AcrR family transcriptional regulator|uniref:TetR/AcrR family transcriptional regulator n=1 Tax=Sinanaerobacter chloroacetimidivorans TaxID=2818044 RepID=A0A8J8B3J7_9FIRM|nr:TetR/AcrR family transcriptional regulator [Sinanaerobacter chloroacetimidivorans]MBR0599827.1 TetR/AcrR family transcriptional regulator [Sinanaerobacter chloroacetimidivorans]
MIKEKTSHRKEQAAETKRKLYESAGQLFGQYEFEDVTVDDIVEAAGVSKGTFYVHFESKDALIASFLSDYVSGVDAEYKAHLDSFPAGTKASDMLLSLISKIAEVLTGTIGYNRMRIVYKVQLTGAVNMEAIKGYNRELYKMFADVLKLGIERGEFRTELPLDTLTKHFVMAIRGISYEWCLRYPDFDLEEQALAHFKILLDGINTRAALAVE